MEEREIIEIEQDFQDAWEDYFGQPMYYVKLLTLTPTSSTYRESKVKTYDEANKLLFHGTFKENLSEEELAMGGGKVIPTGIITFITKELVDQDVEFKTIDVIDVVNLDETTTRYDIIAMQKKVQFGTHKVFTKFGVVEYGK